MPALRPLCSQAGAVASWLVLSAALVSSPARANGRFPRADQLVLAPGSPDELVLRTTFGLLVSDDAGASWDWVCERAIGFSGIEDPPVAVLPNGVLLAGLLEGLAQSSDRGCSWQFAATPAPPLPIIDLSARREAPNLAVALAWERQTATASAPGYRARFFASADGALTWQAHGTGIDSSVLVLTLDVAPSDPKRLYASGIRSGGGERSAALFVSRDNGTSWIERPVPFDARAEQGLYIAAVDPTSPDRVYLRTSGASSSRLLSTGDAGATFQEHYAGGPILGFALSLDGKQIYLGGVDDGLWVGAHGELVFEQRSTLPIVCLTASADALYACSNDLGGFALGVSRDGGRSFEPVLVLSEVRGPLACASGAAFGTCDADWPMLSDRLGIRPASTTVDAPRDTATEPAADDSTTPRTAGCSFMPQRAHGRRTPWIIAILLGTFCHRKQPSRRREREDQKDG
jgi:hypothetical protein